MAGATKSCKCSSSNPSTSAKITKDCPFPEKELREWLKNRLSWNHKDWLDLLENLGKKGFSEWTKCESKKNEIGLFLEKNRKK